MAWPKGKTKEKTGGRTIGTPNKLTQDLFKICEEERLDVFREMVKLAASGDVFMLREIAQYLYPKRKAVEHSGSVDLELSKKAEEFKQLTNEQAIELMKQEIKKLEGGVIE